LNSIRRKKTQKAAMVVSPDQQVKKLQDEEMSRLNCSVGNFASDLGQSISSVLTQVPFSDFNVEECASADANDDAHASPEAHSVAPQPLDHSSISSRRIGLPPSPSSSLRPPFATQISSSQQATGDTTVHLLSQQATATAAEPMSLRLPVAPFHHQNIVEATDGLHCIDDDSVLWAKTIDLMIRTTIQGAPSSLD
jgi:hypothetical protein